MSKKVDVQVVEESVQKSYQEIIEADQSQNKARAQQLAILPEEAKQQIVEATKYSSFYPNPITPEFMETYILAPIEFPTVGSGLAQGLTELNVRIDNLFGDAYMHKKAQLEAEMQQLEIDYLNLEKEELEIEINLEDDDAKEVALKAVCKKMNQNMIQQKDVEIELKKLEIANKNHSLKKTELTAMARYNEAMGWKKVVEKKLKEMGVKDVSEVDFNRIRMDEMQAKIKKWGELHAKGALELTPSKFQAIDSNKEAFAEGIEKGRREVEAHQKLLAAKKAHDEAVAQLELAQAQGKAN